MTLKLSLQLVAVLLLCESASAAFISQQRLDPYSKSHAIKMVRDTFETRSSDTADLERAKQCLDSFGECSVTEMEELRDELHDTRLKSMMWSSSQGGGSLRGIDDTEIRQHRRLEEELNFQLHMLQKLEGDESLKEKLFSATKSSSLVEPDGDDSMIATTETRMLNLNGSVFEDLAFCAVLAMAVLLPNLG